MNLGSDSVKTTNIADQIMIWPFKWMAQPTTYVPGDPIGYGLEEREAIDSLLNKIQAKIDLTRSVNRQQALS
jgi:hypothetical protein